MPALYRAQQLNKKEWVYGYYEKFNGKHRISNDELYGTTIFIIDPKTLWQSTGKKDQNWKEIWQWDLISIFNTIAEVRWSDLWSWWVFFDQEREAPYCDLPFFNGEHSHVSVAKVIGNTTENAELFHLLTHS